MDALLERIRRRGQNNYYWQTIGLEVVVASEGDDACASRGASSAKVLDRLRPGGRLR